MKIAAFAIRNKVVTLVLTFVTIGAGMQAFDGLSRLEDPEFTIKQALVITPYPGASPEEVEEEVTDRLEIAVQQLGQLKRIRSSRSTAGMSIIEVEVKDEYDKETLPQVWDELRRKVTDAQGQLPPGAGPSLVNDDFGDVWGVFIVVYGPEYSMAELREFAKFLRRELTLVKDVAKVQLFADRKEVIYIVPNRDRMSQLRINPEVFGRELDARNLAAPAGRVEFGEQLISIYPSGTALTEEDFESILISGDDSERQIYLRDVAEVRRSYEDPPESIIRYNGKVGVGLGISTVSGGNVVEMGEALQKRWEELQAFRPAGVDVGIVSLQSSAVSLAIDSFVVSLAEAVAIVVVVLLFFMGLRSGILIGFILFLTICATFIFMGPWEVALERISLGALIIGLGMLVDNAIVVVDGMLVKMQQGTDPEQAADEVVGQQALPLLGATVVAVLAFASIGTSQDSTGEFCRSLFQVVFLSLMLSWVTAVTITPLLCVMFLAPKEPVSRDPNAAPVDPYGGAFYGGFRAILRTAINQRWVSIGIVLALFGSSLYGFQFVSKSFFPDSTRPQFMVDYFLPMGTRIERTLEDVVEIEEYLHGVDHVTGVTSITGQGAMRFLVTYTAEKPDSSYAQFLVDVDDWTKIDGLIPRVEAEMAELWPNAIVTAKRFRLGPGDGGRIQIRTMGDDPKILRQVSDQIMGIMHRQPTTKGIRLDWRNKVQRIVPVIAQDRANVNGITREDIASTLYEAFEGGPVGVYREGDELLPIIVRADEDKRGDVANIANLQIWSHAAGAFIPFRQVISHFDTEFEDSLVMRRDRKRTMTVHADPTDGDADTLLEDIMREVDQIELPPGYEIEIGGEYESSQDAQAALASSIPVYVLMMMLVVLMLFNALRQPLIIFLCVPLALIGVTAGLLATDQPFGFMALLGFLSLGGMLIKNAIVLIDQIDLEIREGKEMGDAIIDSAVSRLRPVAMAALTTVLGMIPLLTDAFFVAMAVTIMAGLTFATFLTMLLVPVLYATFFNVRLH